MSKASSLSAWHKAFEARAACVSLTSARKFSKKTQMKLRYDYRASKARYRDEEPKLTAALADIRPGDSDSPGGLLETAITDVADCRHYECHVDTLDRQLLDAGRVMLFKVDVEGHELNVFCGAQEILTRHASILLFECEARHLRQHTMLDIFARLQNLGYAGELFSPDGLLPLNEFDPPPHQMQTSARFLDAPDCCNNSLFTPGNKRPVDSRCREQFQNLRLKPAFFARRYWRMILHADRVLGAGQIFFSPASHFQT
jgi:FkbM family methyltransferase